MLNETEFYHLTIIRNRWIKDGAKENYKLHIPNKYKLEVVDYYFVLVNYWVKKRREWITIEVIK